MKSNTSRWMLCAAALLLGACANPTSRSEPQFLAHPTDLVDPFIGTGGHGHTYPGATVPFGMVQLSPDTRLDGWDGCSGYHFSDSVIFGFSHTHLSGTGVSDYGDILLMPRSHRPEYEGKLEKEGKYLNSGIFRKQDESAGAGWYKVQLKEDETTIELTATAHCGMHRYGYLPNSEHQVSLNLGYRDPVTASGIKVVGDRQVEGYRFSSAWAKDQRLYFALEFSQPMTYKRWEVTPYELESDTMIAGRTDRIIFSFENPKQDTLLVKVGISAVSIEGARKNLEAEIPNWDFAGIKQKAIDSWDQQLHKIEVAGGTPEQQKIFYTALYHTSIVPNLFSDVDGQYRGMDGKAHSASKDAQYSVFSLWDTYRATHPLYTLIEQKRNAAFIRSFLRMYQEGGRLPVWELAGNETECMIGYHSVSVIADAYLKGLRDFDADLALQAMVHGSDLDHYGLEYYKRQGHIGAGDESESVSKTLEYAYDDWCIAEMAHAMGRDSIAARFYQRAQYYKNLFDPATGFFRAKINGCWQDPFDPREVNFNFTEANAWQYSLAVPQDIEGLMALMGGKSALEDHLDQLFAADKSTTGREQADITGLIGQYAHGNEPSHHMAWLYNFTDAPWKAQERIRQILTEMYHAAPDGLSGNEDCGQMSAWYVMSAMGLYAVTPGRPEYHLIAPLFPHVKINLENDKSFEIIAQGTDQGKIYPHSAKLNGKPLKSLVIDHKTILEGGKLEFEMHAVPLPDRTVISFAGDNPRRPASRINAPKIATVPYFIARAQTFTDTLGVRIASVEPGVTIRYTMDGSLPSKDSPSYARPLLIQANTVFQAISVAANGQQSPVARAEFFQIDPNRKLQLLTKYENQYAAGGDLALIDGLRGGPNFRTGRWQGYQRDLEVVIDLGKASNVTKLSVGFLQDIGSWIWMPKRVEFSASQDGKTFTLLSSINNTVADTASQSQIKDFSYANFKPLSTRYIRVRATNYGTCPPWHLGAGGQAWIFADEIVISN
jgi:predicted alpha-1,2-mannosidase